MPVDKDEIWFFDHDLTAFDLTADKKCLLNPRVTYGWGPPEMNVTGFDWGLEKYVREWPKNFGLIYEWTVTIKVKGTTCCDRDYEVTCEPVRWD
jgi:hypothetical protein